MLIILSHHWGELLHQLEYLRTLLSGGKIGVEGFHGVVVTC